MRRLRVWIDYQPKIYTEIFKEVIQSFGLADVLTNTSAEPAPDASLADSECIDLVVISLDNLGRPELNWTPERLQNSKAIAFSPNGDYGLLRLPGKTYWQEIRPFGLKQLIELLLTTQPA